MVAPGSTSSPAPTRASSRRWAPGPKASDHDQRYDLAREWIRAIKALRAERLVTLEGEYFNAGGPASPGRSRTRGPSSSAPAPPEKGMRLTSSELDAIFLSGGDADGALRDRVRVRRLSRAEYGRTIRTYSMMTVVFGKTDAEAKATAEHFRAGLDEGALRGMMRAYGFLDAEIGKENAFVEAEPLRFHGGSRSRRAGNRCGSAQRAVREPRGPMG